jgi:hypothetical protein
MQCLCGYLQMVGKGIAPKQGVYVCPMSFGMVRANLVGKLSFHFPRRRALTCALYFSRKRVKYGSGTNLVSRFYKLLRETARAVRSLSLLPDEIVDLGFVGSCDYWERVRCKSNSKRF